MRLGGGQQAEAGSWEGQVLQPPIPVVGGRAPGFSCQFIFWWLESLTLEIMLYAWQDYVGKDCEE